MTPNDTSDQFISAPPALDDTPRDTIIQPVESPATRLMQMSPKEREHFLRNINPWNAARLGAVLGAGYIASRHLPRHAKTLVKNFPKHPFLVTKAIGVPLAIASLGGAAAFGGGTALAQLLTKNEFNRQQYDKGVNKVAMIKIAIKRHEKDGWHVYSESGKHMGGPYPSESGANKRLQQIEYFKHQKHAMIMKLAMIRIRQNMKTMMPRINMKKIGVMMERIDPSIGSERISPTTKRVRFKMPGTTMIGGQTSRDPFDRGNMPMFR